MAILAVNAGSSSLKFSIHLTQGAQVQGCLMTGSIQGLEPGGTPRLGWSVQGGSTQSRMLAPSSAPFEQALCSLHELLAADASLPPIEAIAHRVVHGGQDYTASVVVTQAVLDDLSQLNSLAPLHQPQNLQGIREFRKAFPHIPQVACFDTAFHAAIPDLESHFALPASLSAQGIRRYGFHGLSYHYVMGRLQQHSESAGRRVLMAHLGNGASLCAAHQGRSCATTMGFSALDGLMMGTRSGSIDPGVLLYLMEQGWSLEQLQTLLYKQSGLLGVSGVSADMRTLRANGSASAQRAIDQFTHRIVRDSGAMVACLGGLDVLAFSGGIGEHDVVLRAQVTAQLAWLGIAVDPELNQQAVGDQVMHIHTPQSRVEVWVVPTDEGFVAAQEAVRLL